MARAEAGVFGNALDGGKLEHYLFLCVLSCQDFLSGSAERQALVQDPEDQDPSFLHLKKSLVSKT